MGVLATFFLIGLTVVVLASLVLWIAGTVISALFGVAWFLLLKVAPLILLGWIVVKLLDRRRTDRGLSPGDRDWLERGG